MTFPTIRCPAKDPKDFVDVALSDGELGREDCQGQWQRAIAGYLNNCTLLDVGAGLCESKTRMAIRGISVTTQDIFPGSLADIRTPISEIPNLSYDAVTSFDVIEHVEDYLGFLKHQIRIARKWIAVSTPNYLVSKNTHRFHVQEFAPDELPAIGDHLGLTVLQAWAQLPGRGVFPVTRSELEVCEDTHGYCILFGKSATP